MSGQSEPVRVLHRGRLSVWCERCREYHEDTTPHRPQPTLIVAGCSDKLRHARSVAALGAAKHAMREHGVELYPYPCRHCGGWHLSRQRVRDFQVRQIEREARA